MSDWASESGHWYDSATGEPRYTIVGKNGVKRDTTLADARRASERGETWYPGASTIVRIPRSWHLEQYVKKQVLNATLTTPRRDEESEEDWYGRVFEVADQHRDKAAERGTQIHAALEAHYADRAWDGALAPWVYGIDTLLKDEFGYAMEWRAEKSFASPLGYGGKVDLHSDSVLLDFKGKEQKNGVRDWRVYDEHHMQLAAYAKGLGLHAPHWDWPTCAIVFFDRADPYCEIHRVKPADLERGWECFRHLLGYWRAVNRYEP